MADRLKQIWGGFQETTTRELTGKGVENIIIPNRTDFDAAEQQFLPPDFESPADRAFATLRQQLAEHEKKFTNRRRDVDFTENMTPPDDTGTFGGEALAASLQSTAFRVSRSEMDYGAFMESDAGKRALKRNRKKKRFFFF